ncbi:MAG: hypothetical protein K0U16_07655 [Gammaproteobacteria bacterium]|nr:hypothetical protein [Gammaproteobacteria bacterium]
MFPSGGNAHAFLVIKNCAAEPTDTKPFWSLTPRGQALMEYVRELGDKLTKKQQRELARCLIDPPPFRRISKPLKAIRPHLVVPSFEDLVTTEVTNIGHAVAHTVMTRKQLLAVLIGEKPS